MDNSFGCADCKERFFSDASYEAHPCAVAMEDMSMDELLAHAIKNVKDPKRLARIKKDFKASGLRGND